MSDPLVSIIVSSYNHEAYINDCLDSLLNQTYSNLELIICDDCSKDDTYKIIESRYEELKSRFTNCNIMKNKQNLGVTKNLNKLLSFVHGDYIKGIASDDMLMPTALEDMIAYIQSLDEKPDLLYSNIYYMDEQFRYQDVSKSKNLETKTTNLQHGRNLTDEIISNNFIPAPAVLFPRSTFEKYGKFDENLYFEDLEYWMRVSIDGLIEYLDKPLVLYRVSNASMSHFAKSKEGIEKYKKMENTVLQIFNMYSEHISISGKARFFNARLCIAMGMHCDEMVDFFFKSIKDSKFLLSRFVRIKLILYKLGLYDFLLSCKNFVKSCVCK